MFKSHSIIIITKLFKPIIKSIYNDNFVIHKNGEIKNENYKKRK